MKTIRSMVEVFSTNVEHATEAGRLSALLQRVFPNARVSFDLEDCDKVLRLEGDNIAAREVMGLLNSRGFNCGNGLALRFV